MRNFIALLMRLMGTSLIATILRDINTYPSITPTVLLRKMVAMQQYLDTGERKVQHSATISVKPSFDYQPCGHHHAVVEANASTV